MAKKHNYLNNKDMLLEIHRSKTSYCDFIDPKYSDYHIILEDPTTIDTSGSYKKQLLDEENKNIAKQNKASTLAQKNYKNAVQQYSGPANKKPKLAQFKIDPESIPDDEIVYRVTTYTHIPAEPGRKKTPKRIQDTKVKLNFIPYKHYIIKNGKPVEVGRSHYNNGAFCLTHGAITDTLANMFMLLVERYSQKANWRGYSYLEEMKGQSLLQLSFIALQFNEAKSANPFAYYTAILTNSFRRVLNIEKRAQHIKDDIMIQHGQNPSFSRQIEYEEQIRKMREEIQNKNNE